ncbi:MAG: FtsX-like permease family protein [Ilumatobacteraceae bacterium]|nr:FtsX-like permease family protein [Ilumatobacteraceae bacterium]MBP7889539.1 FtsX-like permease family protein [Ilumatobacteraceae bacterium]
MFRLAMRSVVARWPRLLLTALAIVASTSFLSGTFIFRDTIERTFDALFADVYERVDGYVQSSNSVENLFGLERRDRLPAEILDEIRAVPGVADAQAAVQGDAVVIAKDGTPIERPTAPTFGAAINEGELSVWRLAEGRLPDGGNDIVLDTLTAQDGGFALGDEVTVNADSGSRVFTLVGIVEYDDIISPGNATWALFDGKTAEEFIAKPGFIDAVLVLGDGSVSADQLVQRLADTLDPEVAEALTSEEITAQTQSEIEKSLSFLTIFLSIFSFIALGVGMFVIYNVFSITAAQRQRENALLRALGANRRQITWSMMIEALVIGLFGSGVGLLGGVGLAAGIKRLLDAFDYVIPARGLAIEPRTVVVTLLAGTLASLLAALGPAIGAGRVPPVAAMSDAVLERVGSVRRRVVWAVISAVIGVGSIVNVMMGGDAVLLAVGVVGLFAAVLLLGPVMARPIARVIGAPVQRARGVTGTMARGNVQRNPRRTARTAAPVLIGVALVTGASVFAASIKEQIRDTVGSTFIGDYVVNSTNGGSVSFGQEFVDQLNEVPEVGVASGLGFAFGVADAEGKAASGAVVNPATAQGLVNLVFVQGTMSDLTPAGILISEGEAKDRAVGIGGEVVLRVDGADLALTVQGIYESSDFIPARTYHRDTFVDTSIVTPAGIVSLTRAAGVSDSQFRAAVDTVVEAYGIGTLQDKREFIDSRADIVDRSLAFIYGLLLLSIMIATFGIVITLLLAVYERRRETGLLRAVGMTRAQVRTTVRWESVITSLYGAAVGVLMGLVLGYVIIVSLRDQGLTEYTIPVASIVWIMGLAFTAGVVAAVVPAWRATRLDILRAIAADG